MWQLVLAQQDPAPTGSLFAGFLPIILILFIFYLLIYRPMRSRQRNLDRLISNLKTGDKVITNAGIYGTVSAIKENTILLKVSDQTKIEVAKNAVAGLQNPQDSSR